MPWMGGHRPFSSIACGNPAGEKCARSLGIIPWRFPKFQTPFMAESGECGGRR